MPVAPLRSTPTPVTPDSRPLAARIEPLERLLTLLRPIPPEWLDGAVGGSRKGSPEGGVMQCLPCSSYRRLVQSWQKALKWTAGLDHALATMLASVTSTKVIGDQIWVKIIGPAACGKSTLCEALSVNREYVLAKSTIRGFHSGYRLDKGGDSQDHSLVSKLYDKTFVTKDGDTLLQAPNLAQILSEGRDIYDGTSRPDYRNEMGHDYEGLRMTWILCGTSSLRAIDSSELGERFLDCVIMDRIDNELEDEILWRVVNRAAENLGTETDGEIETHYDVELAKAMALTGGYVGYLRENAGELLARIGYSDEVKHRCARLGKFTAYMRARPSVHQEENAEREFAPRLASQLTRLAGCLTVVLNCEEVGSHVMKRVTRVAMDTSRGMTLAIASHLYVAGINGLPSASLAQYTAQTEAKVRELLRFMKQIDIVESFYEKKKEGQRSAKLRWRLTEHMAELYTDVVGTENAESS